MVLHGCVISMILRKKQGCCSFFPCTFKLFPALPTLSTDSQSYKIVWLFVQHHKLQNVLFQHPILILLLWKAFVPASLKLIPAPLVAVVIVTLATTMLKLPVLYVEVPDNLWSEIHFPSWTVLQSVSLGVVFQAGAAENE